MLATFASGAGPNRAGFYLVTTVTRDRRPVFSGLHPARVLIQTLRSEETQGRAKTLAFVVMPDHLHWLLQLGEGSDLSEVVRAVKAVSAERLGRPLWQRGFHDHGMWLLRPGM